MLLIEKTTRAHYTVLTASLSLKLFQNEKFTLKKKWSEKMPLLLDKNIKSRSKPHRHKYHFLTIESLLYPTWNIFSVKQQAELRMEHFTDSDFLGIHIKTFKWTCH